ncbi:hypothetical protein IMG5_126140 [Ichthyophthirius multifiliis]|uniref:Fructose-bisphosphatase n=1 Tax=Ichthyophthirius multifiliis TaxID=5932 RepID=G0QVS9_ICHMU|nr:hypothetical protein IMG5_126140 [Ichthyophthirius multifiliis]EGR30678.1 hypothetical protein IMG5_126140 [Ichthyophthirius multifiliis]|eukprot:XP_004032265.1 hypothetical protein IMG5_126140 [Ichthyophthirius multifiliis]
MQNQINIYSDCEELQKIYEALLCSFVRLSDILKYHTTGRQETGQINTFGDIQLDCDTHTDQIIFDELKKTGVVAYALSEETPQPVNLGGNKYIVTFDPLDGSSIIGTNWTVGTIFAVWKNDEKILIGHRVKEIVISGCCLYGPRTTALIYNQKLKSVEELQLKLKQDNSLYWDVTHISCVIQPKGNIFAPGNLRAASENIGYKKCIDYWMDNGYTLRYTGGMVPDVLYIYFQINKFQFLDLSNFYQRKRVLYEVAPLAHLVEMAGGKSSDGKNSLMELEITGYDQRSEIIVGSKDEVEKVEQFLNEKI